MSVLQHTAGPWSLDFGDDGAVVYKEGVATIANIPDDLQSSNANARLIAAAPDLLAALEETKKQLQWVLDELVDIDTLYGLCEPQEALQLAHNAINKAKGITK